MRYFAYGSNMCDRQMADRCPAARIVGPADLPGWRFHINGRGVATILPDPDRVVRGLIWTLTPACEAALDGFEGIRAGHYRREMMAVGGAPALVYIAARTDSGPPRAGYMERILAAAGRLSLAPAYLDELGAFVPPGRLRGASAPLK